MVAQDRYTNQTRGKIYKPKKDFFDRKEVNKMPQRRKLKVVNLNGSYNYKSIDLLIRGKSQNIKINNPIIIKKDQQKYIHAGLLGSFGEGTEVISFETLMMRF